MTPISLKPQYFQHFSIQNVPKKGSIEQYGNGQGQKTNKKLSL
jgi:hypothetical protein